MVARPGRLQSAFTAGELDKLLHERTNLKYFTTGADHMENVVSIPQGGFRWRGGLRDVGGVAADAARLFPFMASDGSVYDIVLRPGEAAAWSATAKLADFTISGLTAGMLPAVTDAQRLDTMLLFHPDLQSKRIKHAGPTSWSVDNLPYVGVPSYDYGGPIGGGDYTNGVPAVWRLEFVGLTPGTSIFNLTVSQQETASITYDNDMTVLAGLIATAIEDLPNVSAGITVTSASGGATGTKIDVEFTGAGNEGDGWALSGAVINKADAAILASKTTVGVSPGEDVISADRGWPRCGTFYNQRLIVGGFKGLPNAWMFSRQADYFSFDVRFVGAAGPALVPMDTDGGEAIERITDSRNLTIFTNKAEYWIAERALSQSEPPNHVAFGERGVRPGAPVVKNEGALNYVSATGSVIGEARFTDVEGNFVSRDVSLLAPHLVDNVRDMAVRRAVQSTSGNIQSMVQDDGRARVATVLREQDIMAFGRLTSGAAEFIATAVNGRNELMYLTDRPDGRRLERLEDDLLLDEATAFALEPASATVTGLSRFNGRETWIVADGHVLGPFTPVSGTVTLPFEVSGGYAGTWTAPLVRTLPPPRDVGPNVVLKRRARLHSAHISIVDSTSLAVAANDGPLREVSLRRFGLAADVPELEQGITDTITVRGLTGFSMEPKLTISQLRPGRLTVRSVTLEYAL
ncbi:phage tail protein [Stappia indica]|uniref:hypothetical protein n=1 Tax=Stappia indica TaxID=538381 RepID=UPI001D18AC10|nr:hypothetical protein [Stappia indica]MCC4243424.1 hypothetical protein [Stappia indica]